MTLEINLWSETGFFVGGAVQITIDSVWTPSANTSCSVTGIESAIPGYPVICQIDGYNVNIANFADVRATTTLFTVTIYNI